MIPVKKVAYFAYGANMSSQKMRERLSEPPETGQPSQIVSSDVHLSFSHRGAFATLVTAPIIQEEASQELMYRQPHGVLYMLDPKDLSAIAKTETGYKASKMLVKTYKGNVELASVFMSKSSLSLKQSLRPSVRYLALLRSGAAENCLDGEYQAWLGNIRAVENDAFTNEYFDTPSILYTNIAFVLGLLAIVVYVAFT